MFAECNPQGCGVLGVGGGFDDGAALPAVVEEYVHRRSDLQRAIAFADLQVVRAGSVLQADGADVEVSDLAGHKGR